MNNDTQIVVRVDSKLKNEVKKIAKKKRISMSSLIKSYLVKLVEREKRKEA